VTTLSPGEIAELEHRLRTDHPFYARKCLKIIDQRGRLVPLGYKDPQLLLDRTLEEQDDAGAPMRAIILKARRIGFSTATEGKITHRYTQRPNHKALVVAHDKKTAGEIFAMSELMYANLPNEQIGDLVLKPPITHTRRQQELALGQPSRTARQSGDFGLNSSLLVDTAGEVQAGRGFQYMSLHLSEVAFWENPAKLTALLNTVPDEPGTLIVVESTAFGHNHFKRMWDGEDGAFSDYARLFFPWFEEPGYARPFLNPEDREEFVASIGEGPWGEEEPDLVEQFGLSPEQLHWRRWAIENRSQSDLRTFHQEYPSTPQQAFLSTGRQVFSMTLVARALDQANRLDGEAEQGLIRATDWKTVKTRGGEIQIPAAVEWVNRDDVDVVPVGETWWRRWEDPTPQGDPADPETYEHPFYIEAIDPAGGDENETGEAAYHAIEIVNQATLEQAAEYRSRVDPDLMFFEAYKAALLFNEPWVYIEVTGGWGRGGARRFYRDYHYPRTYARKETVVKSEKKADRLGFETTSRTKPELIEHFAMLLREGTHGIKSAGLAGELPTFVKDEKGKMGPEPGYFADRAMAYFIAQRGAYEQPRRKPKVAGQHKRPRGRRRIKSPVAGW
jgi:transposase-like protein